MRAAVLLALLVAAAGCYNPAIGEGDFLCGAGGACPQGWKCAPDNRCYKNPGTFDGGGGEAGPPAGGGLCGRGLSCPGGALATQTCDPTCQSGCACNQKCTSAGAQPSCVPAPAAPIDFYGACNAMNDQCRAGALCAREARPICGARCYRACREDADCGGTGRCTEQYLDTAGTFVTKICGPRIEACNPVGASPDCPSGGGPNLGCYILEPGRDDLTGCDCAGTAELGADCSNRHECRPGLECLFDEAAMKQRCFRLCALTGAGRLLCPAGQICQPLPNSTRFGACK